MNALRPRTLLAAALLAGLAGAAVAQTPPRTLTIALGTNVNTLDPAQTATVQTDMSVISHLYLSLITRAPDMSLKPELATEWHAVDDLTWRFTLRAGVTFADGEPLDAAAVKWNVDRVLDPNTKSRIRPWFAQVREVAVLSPTELEIRTKEPYPALPAQLSAFYLLPPTWTQGHNPANSAMSSGRYELSEFVPGDHIVLKARAGWFGDKPAFDTVVFRVIPEAGTRVASIMAGETDFIAGVPPTEFKRIDDSGTAKAASVDSTREAFLKFNALKPPFKDNVKLRQALNHAVDRKLISEAIWGGMGSLSRCQLMSPAYFGFNPDLDTPNYDPELAKKLMAEAGIKPGQLTIEFEVPIGPYLMAQDVAEAIAANLQDIGVDTKIVDMDFGAFMDKQVRAHDMGQMAYLTYAWPTLDADGILSLFETGNPYSYWNDPTFDDLIRQGRTTTDPARRIAIYRQATQRLCDQAPVLFLFNQPVTYATSKHVRWQARGDDWLRAWDFIPQ